MLKRANLYIHVYYTLPTFPELLSGDSDLQLCSHEILPLERQPHLQLKYMYLEPRPCIGPVPERHLITTSLFAKRWFPDLQTST
jgi:hypothetical protein